MLLYTYSESNIKITMESSAATFDNASSSTTSANTNVGSANAHMGYSNQSVDSTSSTPLREKCLSLIIKLGPYNKSGTPFLKKYTASLAKMLGFIVNMYDDETLNALIDGLENVLVAYMPDITELFVAKTLEETDYNQRYELLQHLNNMVADQMRSANAQYDNLAKAGGSRKKRDGNSDWPINIKGTLDILGMVRATSAFPLLKSGAKL
jgi:hypothetical protein